MKKTTLKLLVFLAFTSSMFFSCEPRTDKSSEQEVKKREEQKDELLLDALGIRDLHMKRPQLNGLVVYK